MSEFLAPALRGADKQGSIQANGLELAYEQFGDDADPALILIMGLGMQLTGWPDAFCRALAYRGLRVIRFDNRDIGLSTKLRSAMTYDTPRKAFFKAMFGRAIRAPYTLDDMADDVIGLMDGLKIDSGHIVGASMGGMVAQLVTARHPDRVLTLTSIMSSSGAKTLPRARLAVLLRLTRAPRSNKPKVVAEHMARTMRVLGSRDPAFERSHADWVSEIRRSVERSYYPPGTTRQTLAVMAAPSRADLLGGIEQPVLVIHGRADPLLPVKHGRETARALALVHYEEIRGMGHDLPPRVLPRIVQWISDLTHGRLAIEEKDVDKRASKKKKPEKENEAKKSIRR